VKISGDNAYIYYKKKREKKEKKSMIQLSFVKAVVTVVMAMALITPGILAMADEGIMQSPPAAEKNAGGVKGAEAVFGPGDLQWDVTFEENIYNDGFSVQQTSDGGYIVLGLTYDGINGDVWLIKTDAVGTMEWYNFFDESTRDAGLAVEQTSDGGYIITGQAGAAGTEDVWLIKTDANGTMEWDKTYSGTSSCCGYSVQQTSDGGFIVAGYQNGGWSSWVIKTDASGDMQWNATYYPVNIFNSVEQTIDGGYILAGYVGLGADFIYDMRLVKIDANGTEEWNRIFGGNHDDYGISAQQTPDSGYIIGGQTQSYGAGDTDAWLVKTDAEGIELWNKTYGGSNTDICEAIDQTADGGYMIVGGTQSYGAGDVDFWLVKTDANGTEEWNATYGSGFYECARDGQQTADGGYILIGRKKIGSFYFIWLVKAKGEENHPPYVPSNPNPVDGATDVDIEVDLSWTGGDPDGDLVLYDVYFGTTSPPSKTVGNQSSTTFDPGTLNLATLYYWQIIAWDGDGASTMGSIWQFTTQTELNAPPSPPDIDGTTNGKVGTRYPYTFISTDSNEDDVSYYIEWGDGETTSWTTLQPSGSPGYIEGHTWEEKDAYTIRAKARDSHGLESDWATLEVTMPLSLEVHLSLLLRILRQIIPNGFPLLQQIIRLMFIENNIE
jgi:hypothetical protein